MVHRRLLETAIREFGIRGLEGASTRGIAAAADTAMSSITYHYGGKEGLYLAAADYIASQMEDVVAGIVSADGSLPETEAEARAAIHTIMQRLTEKMASDATATWASFVLREQLAPTEAFDRIYAGPMGRMTEALVELVCIASRRHERFVSRVIVITLLGQVMAIRAARATCTKLLERAPSDPRVVAALKARVASNTDAILDRLIAEQEGQA